MKIIESAKFAVASLAKKGAKAQCKITQSEKHELNVAAGNISLFRTTYNTAADLLGFVDGKKGNIALNKTDPEALEQGAWAVVELAGSSKADPANDIAGFQPPQSFAGGPLQADRDTMYARLKEFLAYAKQTYPHTILEEINFDFTRTESLLVNSNGVEFQSNRGIYNFNISFMTKDGAKTSSEIYMKWRGNDLNTPLQNIGGLDRLLAQSAGQLDVKPLPEAFAGSVIMTPESLSDFIGHFTGFISNFAMISGNSVYKDKLNQIIADPRLTLRSEPLGSILPVAYYFTDDGYQAKNSTIVANGILTSFILNLYAANKTGRPRSENMGGCYVIEAGDSNLDEMIASTAKGILLGRFSGGEPGNNGDFSGVAKNSYYIEKGKIQYPITETMVSGNIVTMLKSIEQISGERNNNGYHCLPWIKFGGMTISGK